MAAISAKNGNRRISQIMLRWAIQRGCAVIPGTGNPEHMKVRDTFMWINAAFKNLGYSTYGSSCLLL